MRAGVACRWSAIGLVLSAAVGSHLLALDPTKLLTQYGLDVWQVEQGLPQNAVDAIVQTRDGYLWLGTQEGLVRFDGVRFVVFDKSNTPGLGHNWVRALLEDTEGSLWIGTDDGLTRMSNRSFAAFTRENGFAGGQVLSLCLDRKGRVWIGTNAGLSCYRRSGGFITYTTKEGLTDNRVWAVCEDGVGDLWIGTNAGLNRLSGDRITSYTTGDGLPDDRVSSIAVDRNGKLWVGTARGLACRADGRFRSYGAREGLFGGLVTSIFQDRSGNLWIGTNGGGLNRFDGVGFSALTTEQGLASDRIYAVTEDREGSLWVGSHGGGLFRLRDGRFTAYTKAEGLAADEARCVYQDRSGVIWVGTFGGGLCRFADGKFSTLSTKDGLTSNSVWSICEDDDGSLWLGTSSGGLSRYRNGRFTNYTTDNGLTSNDVRAVYQDRSGNLWIGTYGGGVNLLSKGRFTAFTTRNGLPNDQVCWIHEDRAGDLWFGTDGGLTRLHDGTFTAFTGKNVLSNENLNCIYEDAEGDLWIGTTGGGLIRYRNGTFKAFTMRDGLYDDVAFQILEDARGNFWMSCNKGIFRVKKAELNELAAGKRDRVTCVSYGIADGMKRSECNGGTQPAGWKTADGNLWFPTEKGVVVINPEDLPENRIPPPVIIEEVIADNRPVGHLGGTRLRPGTDKFEFHYTALSFLAPEKVRFQYKLEGLESDWIDAATRRTAYYTNLPSGRYTFRVMAWNSDGTPNPTGASFPFSIAPHVYETWWFIVLASFSVVALGAWAYRARVGYLEAHRRELMALVEERTASLKEEKEKTEQQRAEAELQRVRAEEASRAKSVFLANMSHELRTPLNAILGFVQLMSRSSARSSEDQEQLEIITRSGEHLLGLINEVLSISKIESGRLTLTEKRFDLARLLQGLEEMFRPRARDKGLDLVFERDSQPPEMVVGDEGKLRQVLINLLGNALKFTENGRVAVRVSWNAGVAYFEIADTGQGIAADDLAKLFEPFSQVGSGRTSREGTGLGLAISRGFVRLMGGEIGVSSEIGRGSVFEFRIPLPAVSERAVGEEAVEREKRVVGLVSGQERCRVLVVDDKPENRELLAKQLSVGDMEVSKAAGGAEAIEIWRRARPRLIWMDIRMPGMDGYEATRRIRKEEQLSSATPSHTIIIALTASVFEEDREAILAAGCDDFLNKPYKESDLFDKLTKHLGLQFIYEEVTYERRAPSLDPNVVGPRLTSLPAEVLAKLREALERGDDRAAASVAEELNAHDQIVAAMIGRAIRDCQFDQLLNLIESSRFKVQGSKFG